MCCGFGGGRELGVNVALRSQPLNLISLCTGGGGLDLGFELAVPGARSVVLVEREAFACSHLVSAMSQGLMDEAAIWSDVTTFDGRPWRGLVDGVIGGIPCQPHSLAGKRQGSDDERDLWSDARRIIVQSGAWFVLIENVSGMLSAKPGLDPGALRVRRDLSRLGFDVEAGLFTAAEVGASHERERVFILAVADPDRRQLAWRPAIGCEAAGGRPHTKSARSSARLSELMADAGCNREQRRRGAGDVLCTPGRSEGERDQRQRDGDAACDRSEVLAGADDARLEGHRQSGERSGERPARPRGGELVNAACDRRREGRPEPELRSGRDAAGVSGAAVAYADFAELRREPSARQQPLIQSDDGARRAHLFPPGPSDLRSWASLLASAPELEPAFRRVADGLASRLDIARVDRLRMLGNGVVCLEAAYAVRTLLARLAEGGSAGAAQLIGMMELAA